MAVPNIFGSATSAIPLSQLDQNFATAITLGNTAVYLGNTTTSLGNVTLTNVTVSSGNVTVTGANVSGNLTFTGTGNRITGDFSNATFANRVAFQTSTTNTATTITVLPNGTSTTSQVQLYSNSDPTNSSRFTVAALSTEATIRSDISGTGTYLPMTLHTGGSESLRLSATTKAVILAGGSTSANGTGITFPATQSASTDVNTLDDYEEGTWTPVITGTSTAGTATYTTQSGTYVKIGKYVFLQMFVVFSSAHTGTGGTKVGGFPFTIGADFGGGGTITYKTAWVTNGPDFMQGEATTTFGYLRYDNNTTQENIAPNVNIQNTTGFMLSIWYLSDN